LSSTTTATALPPTFTRRGPTRLSVVGHRLRGLAVIGSIVLVGLLAGDWIASVSLATLFVGLRYVLREPGPPIVAAAFSNQWLQVTAGLMYFALSGRTIFEMRTPVYRPMVLIGLGCVAVLFTGFYLAAGFRRGRPPRDKPRLLPWTTNQIAAIYGVTVAGSGVLTELAWSTSGLTQAILVFSRVRYVLLFLLITRLVRPTPRWMWILGILTLETGLGFAGFFADFREPLVIAAIAVLGAMDRRQPKTWIVIGSLALLAVSSGLIWTAIKPVLRKNYIAYASRSERLNAVFGVTGGAFGRGWEVWKYEGDSMVSRIWAVYFPALALTRVPSVLPHENGAIMKGAIENVVTPRLLFPNKPALPSQSDEVRKYAGVWVGGRETNTSYAFGYAGEAYVDFGLPLMFLPIFVFGGMLGFAYRFLNRHIRHYELRTGVLIVIVWSTLGVYEASWVMLIGPSVTILAILGGGALMLDRVLTAAERSSRPRAKRGVVKSWATDPGVS
jgi:hypothetical protein